MASDAGTSNHVYVHSTDHSWVPARVVEYQEGAVVVSVARFKDEDSIQCCNSNGKSDSETIQLKNYTNQQLPLQNVNENGLLAEVEDMVDLPFLHEPAILYNLKARHQQGKPYTRTGDIVIAVNPYQWMMDLYTNANKAHYANQLVWNDVDSNADAAVDARTTVAPHVYETSSLAYRGLAVDGQDQSILVSGESGAGKTETVKILMSHIASVQRIDIDDADDVSTTISPIVQRVLDSNPLLEAFGNAKTSRNDNSSRFGKYLQLQFDAEDATHAAYEGKAIPSCVLAGSKCEVFLLEKSRIVGHDDEEDLERNYHIFYQLLAAPEDVKAQIWSGLEGTDNESFSYVGYTSTDTIEGKSDGDRFQLTKQALALIGVTDELFLTLMRSMCIVLQLGNLLLDEDEEDEERSCITTLDELTALSGLFGVGEDEITHALTERTVRARSEVFTVPLKADQAMDARDALAKEIYAKTFLWLVRTINDATCAEWNYHESSQKKKTDFGVIGMLDIFGFESFKVNRFEQLCINHANEKLQQKFTQDIFRSVQAEYEFEGIALGEVQYEDNAHVLDLMEGRMGMICILNEECLRPKGSDTAFRQKVAAVCNDGDASAFIVEKSYTKVQFGIAHYAGKVVYDATNFVQKNMDALPSDLLECAKKSSNAIVANELENESMVNEHGKTAKKKAPPKKKAPSRGGRAATATRLVHSTVWTKFKTQLNTLMALLGETRTRYIRCIKPNTRKEPRSMMHQSTVEQLRCAGVVAAVTISRSAFPNRLEHDVVLDRFKSLRKYQERVEEGDGDPLDAKKKDVEHLLSVALQAQEVKKGGATQRSFVIGRTRAYFRAGALEHLEAERLKGLGTRATEIQRMIRGYVAKAVYQRKRRAAIRAVARMRCFVQRRKYRRALFATVVLQCWTRCRQASVKLFVLRHEHSAAEIQKIWRSHVALVSFKKSLRAAVAIQAIARGAIQRPRFRDNLIERREEAKLENQLKTLQRKLEEAEQRRIEAEKKAAEKPKEIVIVREQEKPKPVDPVEEEEEKKNEPASAVSSEASSVANKSDGDANKDESIDTSASRNLTAHQQQLMDESGRMLEYLRKEVFKLRSHNAQLRTDFDLLKENNQRLMDANASAGASFAALNQHAKQLNKGNAKLSAEVSQYKQQLQRMHLTHVEVKEELRMKQATYISEVHSRLQYQKTMVKIVDAVQERCRDSRLVEDIFQMSDACEEAHMEGPTLINASGEGGYGEMEDSNDASIVSRFKSFFS